MRTPRLLILAILLLLPFGSAAHARKNVTTFPLQFRPTEETVQVGQLLPEAMTRRPVELQVLDGRRQEDPAAIGTRSDDDDVIHTLRAGNEVRGFVQDAVGRLMREWRVPTGPDADQILEMELTKLRLTETDKAVGATYKAEVQIRVVLRSRAGTSLWTADIFGDATRYGRKRSAENSNEVLSDALVEAVVSAFEHRNLQAAWATGEPTPTPTASSPPRD